MGRSKKGQGYHGKLEEKRKEQGLDALEPIVGERCENEENHHIVACNDYLRMGLRRSVPRLARRYRRQKEETGMSVPSTSEQVMYRWSSEYGWIARAEAYDYAKEIERTERAEEVMNEGFALAHERVHALNVLAKDLLGELYEKGFWGTRKKILKTEGGDRVINERFFRKRPVDAIRGVLDDIAQETGGRIQQARLEVSGLAGMLSQAKGFSDEGLGARSAGEIEDAKYRDVDGDVDGEDEDSGIASILP
jgi:hypothetical protein